MHIHLQIVPIAENTMSIQPNDVYVKYRLQLYGQSHPFR